MIPHARAYYSWLLALIALLLWTVTSEDFAQSQAAAEDTVVIPKMDDSEVFDGRIEDPAWDEALLLPLVQHRPDFGRGAHAGDGRS